MKRRSLLTSGAALGFSVPALSQALPAPSLKPIAGNNPSRVLFVGNSYFYYNDSLHNALRGLIGAAEPGAERRLQFKSATIGGAQLAHHNIDWLTEPGRIGVKDPFEWVVLAGNSADALSDAGRAEFRDSAAKAARTITARGGKVAIYMVHAYVPPHRQAKADNIRSIERYYTEVANELGALVIPVGLAFERAYAAAPELKLHQSYDGSHPNPAGTYLAACTTLAALYAKSPVGNSFDMYGKIDAALRAQLQAVAQEATAAYFNRAA
jgi:hypothetical protein